ncbi:MAG: phosphoglycerate mutase [Burkholderiales bacterium]
MPASPHLLIPYAVGSSDGGPAAGVPPSGLPNLRRLLAVMAPERTIETPEDCPAMPHELALAAALGLPIEPGCTPWAAHETGTVGTPCAFVRLCHWQVGMDRVYVLDPALLALSDDESRRLMQAAAPWFAEDGILLSHHLPGVWLATGEPFRRQRAISLDRVIGRPVSRELLQSVDAPGHPLTRLQSEMQLLLYDHPVADERMKRGQLHPNAIWFTGAGVLEEALPQRPDLRIEGRLGRPPWLAEPAVHEAAWREVDATSVADLARKAARKAPVRLTLCGERRAITFAPHPGGFMARLAHRFGAADSAALLATL